MIITKTIHVKNKPVPSVIGKPILRTETKAYHIEKCLVTTIRVFGIPVYRKTEAIPPMKNNFVDYDNVII